MTAQERQQQKDEYCNEVAPLFQIMFPMINGVGIMAKKMELKASRHKLRTTKEMRRDIGDIEKAAQRLYTLCENYRRTYLFTNKTTEEDRDNTDYVLLYDSNRYIYYNMRLFNALVGDCDALGLLQLDTTYKIITKTRTKDTISEQLIKQFNIK